MSRIEHASVSTVVAVSLIDSLIDQVQTTHMPRIREATVRQMYSLMVTLGEISNAVRRDLEAGDKILNAMTNEEQNAAPETQMWLQWLAMYELAETQIQRISDAIPELHSAKVPA